MLLLEIDLEILETFSDFLDRIRDARVGCINGVDCFILVISNSSSSSELQLL